MKQICTLLFLLACAITLAQTTDANGKKQGLWKKKDAQGKLIYEGNFVDDKPVGVFKYYYPNDSLRAWMSFRKDGKSSYAKMYHPTGYKMAEGVYSSKEVKDSVWTYYDPKGKVISREGYKAGVRDGDFYVYFADGNLSQEQHYVNGQLNGPSREYLEGKKLKSDATYVNGKLEGKEAFYYPNGIEASYGTYKNGHRDGPWFYKNEKGSVVKRELYKMGELASPKETAVYFAKMKSAPQSTPTKTVSAPSKSTTPAPKKPAAVQKKG